MITNFAVAKPHISIQNYSPIKGYKEMCDKKILAILLLLIPTLCRAEFYTITREKEIPYRFREKVAQNIDSLIIIPDNAESTVISANRDSLATEYPDTDVYAPKCYTYTSPEKRVSYAEARGRRPRQRCTESEKKMKGGLPELTIPNLLREIEKNGIKYPKIVLAQAILETGWFKSSVCRNKNNLFGLTNPRTKTYYEFDHWTESVAAYYSKVQYKYKGGNYLLWLRDIGYAEDKGYIQALIRVLKQL